MSTLATLVVKMMMDSKQLDNGLAKASNDVRGFSQSVGKWGAQLSGANGLRQLIGFTGVGPAAVAGIKMITSAASDAAEAQSAVNQVYGEGAAQVNAWSQQSAQNFGMSRGEYLATMSVMGVYGDILGMNGEQTAAFSNDLVGAAADLGSFYNANTTDVLSAMQSALRGEFDPLERFGIMMNQATLDQYALEKGIWDGNGAMTSQQRIMAAQGYIMDNMGAAAGDFARTSDGLANSQKILRAQIADVASGMGATLLPAATKVAGAMKSFFNILLTGNPMILKLASYFLVFLAVLGPALMLLGSVAGAISAIAAAFGAGGALAGLTALLGPIALIIGVLVLLGVAYKKNFLGFGDAINSVVDKVQGFFKTFKTMYKLLRSIGKYTAIESVFRALGYAIADITGLDLKSVVNFFTTLGTAIQRPIDAVMKIVGAFKNLVSALVSGDWSRAFQSFKTIFSGIGDLISSPAKAIGLLLQSISTGIAPIDAVLTSIGEIFVTFGRLLQEIFQGDLSGALAVAQRIFGNFVDLFQSYGGLLSAAGSVLISLLSSAISGLWTYLSGIDWASLATTLVNGLSTIGTYIVGAATWLLQTGKELIVGIMSGVSEYLPILGQLLGAIGLYALGFLVSAVTWLVQTGRDLIAGILTGISEYLPIVGQLLMALGAYLLPLLGGAVSWLLQTGRNLIAGILTGISEYLPILGQLLGALGLYVLSFLANAIAWLIPKGRELIVGVMTGISEYLPILGQLVATLGVMVFGYVGSLLSTLLQKGRELIVGVMTGVSEYIPILGQLVATLGGLVFDYVGSLIATLLQRGRELIGGVMNGWSNALVGLSMLVKGFPRWITGEIGSLLETLKAKGDQLVTGIMNGWTGGLEGLKRLVGKLAGEVVSAASGVWQAGWDIGWSIGEGLISGISSIWDSVINYAKSLANAIIDIIKNPLKVFSPSKIMIWMMEMVGKGMVIGLQNSLAPVSRAAGALGLAGTPVVTDPGLPLFSWSGGSSTSGAETPMGRPEITINIDGAQDPTATANEVYRVLSRELGLRGEGV